MSENKRINAYEQQQALESANNKDAVEVEVVPNTTTVNYGGAVRSAIGSVVKSLMTSAKAGASQPRGKILALYIVSTSIVAISSAIYLPNANMIPWYVHFLIGGLTAALFTKAVVWLLPKQKAPSQAPKPKALSPQEQMQKQLLLMQLMGG